MKALNIQKVLLILKSKKGAYLIAIFLILLLWSNILYKNNIKIENLKKELLQTKEKIPSAEEKKLIEFKNKIIDAREKINSAKIKKAEAIKIIEKYSDFKTCFEDQVSRVIDGEESLLKYCENKFSTDQGKPEKVSTIQGENHIAEVSKKVLRNDWAENDKRQNYINYVLVKAGKDALLTFTGENTFWTIDRPSTLKGTGGYRAYGFCQLYYKYHKPFIDSEDFKKPYVQLDYCIGVYKDAEKRGILNTTFYAYPGRNKWKYLYNFK